MNAHVSTPTAAPQTDSPDLRAERQMAWLDRVAEAGLDVVAAIQRRAEEARPEEDLNALAMAYARAARAVRMTILLQSKLVRDEALAAPSRRAVLAEAQRSDPAYVHKTRVERIVERVAKAEHGDDEDEVERLVFEAGERLDDDDVYRDVETRPVGELVALICLDLDLSPDWRRLAKEAWAVDEAAEGDPRSPFAKLTLPPQPQAVGVVEGASGDYDATASPRPSWF